MVIATQILPVCFLHWLGCCEPYSYLVIYRPLLLPGAPEAENMLLFKSSCGTWARSLSHPLGVKNWGDSLLFGSKNEWGQLGNSWDLSGRSGQLPLPGLCGDLLLWDASAALPAQESNSGEECLLSSPLFHQLPHQWLSMNIRIYFGSGGKISTRASFWVHASKTTLHTAYPLDS